MSGSVTVQLKSLVSQSTLCALGNLPHIDQALISPFGIIAA
ncbi:MAG: hypothetical protein R2911_40150 [Caldilineaceae bacterium]